MKRALFLTSVCYLLLIRVASAGPSGRHVKASLLADVSAIQPGVPFTAGVLLEIDPGWHVYWSNPGDSGLATAVMFKLPQGFTASPLMYPVPRRIEQLDNGISYGYESQVLLTARITPPKDLKAGANVGLESAVSWVACEQLCVPGKARPSVSLMVADRPRAANETLFKEWLAMMPTPADRSADVKHADAVLDAISHVATVNVKWKQQPSDVQVFPGADDAVAVSNIEIRQASGGTTRITFNLKLLAARKPSAAPNRLPVVIAYTDGAGKRRGVETIVPVAQ